MVKDLERIKEIYGSWNVVIDSIQFIDQGDATLNWNLISKSGEKFILRAAGEFHDYVEFQCSLIDFLRKEDFQFSVPEIIATTDDRKTIVVDGQSFLLYRYIDGSSLSRISATNISDIARLVGNYHSIVSDFEASGWKQLRSKNLFQVSQNIEFIDSCIEAIKGKYEAGKYSIRYLESIDNLKAKYESIIRPQEIKEYEDLPKIPCHGDLDKRNFIENQGRISGLIDFGGVTIEPKICDIQNFMHLNLFNARKFNFDLAKRFLSGYRKFNPDINKELKYAAPLMYAENLISLSWILLQKSKGDLRIGDIEIQRRLEFLEWVIDNEKKLKDIF